MRKKIAVDNDLSGLKDVLSQEGYDVVDLAEEQVTAANAVIISGMEQNVMQREDIRTRAPVISAQGKTDDEIVKDLQEHFAKLH